MTSRRKGHLKVVMVCGQARLRRAGVEVGVQQFCEEVRRG